MIAVQPFDFLGGSLSMGVGEGLVRRDGSGGRREAALHPVRLVRRRAHAGGHSFPDAVAAHDHRRGHAARGRPALHRRAHRSDLWRRQRVLRDAGRHPDRRARRADRFRRPARDRADDPRAPAGRIPARRISARARHDRHDRASPRIAPDAGQAHPSGDEAFAAARQARRGAARRHCNGQTRVVVPAALPAAGSTAAE